MFALFIGFVIGLAVAFVVDWVCYQKIRERYPYMVVSSLPSLNW